MSGEAQAPAAAPDDAAAALTPRQGQILALLQAGKSNKEIAAALGIGLGTVKQHINVLFRKLDVSNRTMAVLRGGALAAPPAAGAAAAELSTDGPLEVRPAVVLGVTLTPEALDDLAVPESASEAADEDARADPAAAVHAVLAGVASDFGATLIARGDGGDLMFGIRRSLEQDVLRALRGAFAAARAPGLHPAAGGLRMGLDTGMIAAGITAGGNWDGQIAAGPLLARARAEARRAPPGHLALGPAARERIAALCGLTGTVPEILDLAAAITLPYGIAPAAAGLRGRGSEVGILESAVENAAAGRGHAVLVEGEAGIGKSALLAVLPDLCAEAGATFDRWRCLPADGQPLTSARGCLMNVGTREIVEGETVVGWLQGAPDARPDAPPAPSVIAVDDAHWLPRPVAGALFQAAAAAAASGRLVVVAARPVVSAGVGPIPGGRQIRLGRLDRLALEALVDGVAPVPLRPEARAAICDRAAGVPLFAVELARAVDEAGAPPAHPPLPVLALLAARLDGFRLDHRLLHLLAERPGQRRVAALRDGWAGPPEEFDRALARAVSCGLLQRRERPEPAVFIPHPMVFAVLNFVMTHWKTAGGTP